MPNGNNALMILKFPIATDTQLLRFIQIEASGQSISMKIQKALLVSSLGLHLDHVLSAVLEG